MISSKFKNFFPAPPMLASKPEKQQQQQKKVKLEQGVEEDDAFETEPQQAKQQTAVDDAELRIDLGNKKFITVSQWNKQTLVNIREYYADKTTGELKPGKKGIALKPSEFEALLRALPEIDSALKLRG